MSPRRRGGAIPPYVKATVRWELHALGVRLRQRVRPTRLGDGPFRLDIGAGGHGRPGWTTVDIVAPADIVTDVRWHIPLPDGSCTAIFCEHLVEHLHFRDDVPRFLAECRRLLAPGAPIRLSVPDASRYLRAYVAGQTADLGALHPEATTPMTVVNWAFHGYGHRFGWDGETLVQALRDAGFEDVEEMEFGLSRHADLALDRPERAVESLYVEALAPSVRTFGSGR
ncbi:MAG TPA: methyltransferase domain-containing protein [Acidimicrobiales bacterium]|nr:methyltransferase domain-containing protein [Acidimicrobiales bacterium]